MSILRAKVAQETRPWIHSSTCRHVPYLYRMYGTGPSFYFFNFYFNEAQRPGIQRLGWLTASFKNGTGEVTSSRGFGKSAKGDLGDANHCIYIGIPCIYIAFFGFKKGALNQCSVGGQSLQDFQRAALYFPFGGFEYQLLAACKVIFFGRDDA